MCVCVSAWPSCFLNIKYPRRMREVGVGEMEKAKQHCQFLEQYFFTSWWDNGFHQDSQCLCLDNLFHCSILLSQPKRSVACFFHSHLAPESLQHEQALRDKRAAEWSKEGSLPEIILGFTGVFRKKCSWLWVAVYLTAINVSASSHRHPSPINTLFVEHGME